MTFQFLLSTSGKKKKIQEWFLLRLFCRSIEFFHIRTSALHKNSGFLVCFVCFLILKFHECLRTPNFLLRHNINCFCCQKWWILYWNIIKGNGSPAPRPQTGLLSIWLQNRRKIGGSEWSFMCFPSHYHLYYPPTAILGKIVFRKTGSWCWNVGGHWSNDTIE